jgi:hypothetical protein
MAKSSIESDSFFELLADLAKAQQKTPKKKNNISVAFHDAAYQGGEAPKGGLAKSDMAAHAAAIANTSPLVKSVLNVLNGGRDDSIERLAFETDPYLSNTYQSLFKRKLRLLPDELLKRIAIQDDLVASIVNTRSMQLAAFGRPQPDRFSTGFVIEAEPGLTEHLDTDAKKRLQDQISRAEELLLTCGQTRGWSDHEDLGFGHFLFMQARNAVVFGRCATEVIYTMGTDGKRKFHSFRPIDAGTIYRAQPLKEAAQSVREAALSILEGIRNKKLKPEKYVNDEYPWVQVIHGTPKQVFTAEECLVHNFYPTTDIELDGYPITPLDTVISSVVTHINITTHNKLYFQSGRAARGMIVIKSDDVDETIVGRIRQQFMASINSVSNAWRMPIFGVGSDDDISWQPIDNSARDMEFQYLSDTNARVILSAFQMSPEELPGYAHLSRGTNNQALSESNNEYKLEAHRDVGIRPLIGQFQNYINQKILPLIDADLAKIASVKFVGLDVDTAEKEATRLQQDMAVHMTADEVLEKVEKKAIGKQFGGQFLLNPQWQQVVDKYCYQGDIMEYFFGMKGASKDPSLRFINNPMWFQWQEFQLEVQQMQMQQQQMQQQAQMQQQQGGQPGQPGQDPQQGGGDEGQDLTRSADQLVSMLSKGEDKLPPSRRRLLRHQRKVIEHTLNAFEQDAEAALRDIVKTATKHVSSKVKK